MWRVQNDAKLKVKIEQEGRRESSIENAFTFENFLSNEYRKHRRLSIGSPIKATETQRTFRAWK